MSKEQNNQEENKALHIGVVRRRSIQEMEYQAEENECANMYLDNLNIPRKDESGEDYSTVGRIKYLERNERYTKI